MFYAEHVTKFEKKNCISLNLICVWTKWNSWLVDLHKITLLYNDYGNDNYKINDKWTHMRPP